MPHAEPNDADAESTEAVKLGGGDEISVSIKAQQSECARSQNTDHRPAPWVVHPPDRLGGHIGLRMRSKPLQSGLLLAHIVDELDARVGSQFLEDDVIDGIVGVEDYSIALLWIIDA
jgi:hypothetical protein